MPPTLTRTQFLERAHKAHGNAFNYEQVHYISAHTKITILCPQHGPFEQSPTSHLRGVGCPKCKGGVKGSLERFLIKARQVHGEAYDYSKSVYLNTGTKLTILCPQHGPFEQRPLSHLSGARCRKCAGKAVSNTADFIAQAQQVHGNKYNYSQAIYEKSSHKLIILCPQHGPFEQAPNPHLRGAGCPVCGITKGPKCSGGWGATSWAALQAGRPALLYVVQLSGGGEEFYKVGITFKSVKRRFTQNNTPYLVKQVATFSSPDAVVIYEIESAIKKQFKALRYKPNKLFNGHTECYCAADPILMLVADHEAIKQVY